MSTAEQTFEPSTQKTKGPFFEGQRVEPCGHYYPEVMRLRDEKREEGDFIGYVRIVNCCFCGDYEIELPSDFRPRPKPQEINEKDIPRIRQSELDRIINAQKSGMGKR